MSTKVNEFLVTMIKLSEKRKDDWNTAFWKDMFLRFQTNTQGDIRQMSTQIRQNAIIEMSKIENNLDPLHGELWANLTNLQLLINFIDGKVLHFHE